MKKAFTMLELVMVIVVVGILAAVAIPRTQSNSLSEAATQVISHIRYTQHLAMVDDKFDVVNNQWYLGRWQISFSNANGTISYMIFSERQGAYNGNPDSDLVYSNSEVAVNPLNNRNFLIGTEDNNFANDSSERLTNLLDIGNKYSIQDFVVSGGSTGSTSNGVIFDSLGRPYRGNTDSGVASVINSPQHRLAISTINIKLCIETCTGSNATANNNNEIVIAIEPETGYAHIL
ncbi:pilus assembly FimT family protein [Candidatus Sulfurimonas baltica]|uniref:Type II secretion system protein n=1 Tax=Candidatus Sulfurimonas baltica TaxID=2740404 RepID=A0A7S7LU47_9BACT|nr:type II secretion system protein [Candidatus Sulfurimonas baltica]QOY51443.1 type II secretion system protein [Candidatus Sulfurimonas baltica]